MRSESISEKGVERKTKKNLMKKENKKKIGEILMKELSRDERLKIKSEVGPHYPRNC